MAFVKGFRAFRFDPEKVNSLEDVWAPPYDVISEEERLLLTQRSPHNMAHLLLPQPRNGLDKYTIAGLELDNWIAQGALRQDTEDSLYLLEQRFVGMDGASHVRRGFFAVTRLPEEGETIVLGHERTFSAPVEDRLRLTEAARANLGPIFVLYADPERRLAGRLAPNYQSSPHAEATTFDGTQLRLWRMPFDPYLTDFFSDKKLYIADGHHRFETARHYRSHRRDAERPGGLQPYDFTLMGFVAFEDPGLQIYPPHRILDAPPDFEPQAFLDTLAPWFDIVPVVDGLPGRVKTSQGCTFGFAFGTVNCLITLRDGHRDALLGADRAPAWRDLDVAVLHRGIIERILGLPETTELTYRRDAQAALDVVAGGGKRMAFLLKPVRPDEVRACAEAGEPMPPKSTYFHPKLPSGPVIHRLV